jgi:hypothetical protein
MSRISLSLAHRDNRPHSIGCEQCETLPTCGGLHIDAGVWNCDSYCRCADRTQCSVVCRNKPDEYARREREVHGFDLGTVPHAPVTPLADLPAFVPLVYGNTGLTQAIPAPAVAVPLERVFYARDGRQRFSNGVALRRHYRVGSASKLVLSGVSRDRPIERYWECARTSGFLDWLAAAKPDLVTVPNFSLFNDVPREDNLHAMKRIAISWQELAARRIPTALHLNARTARDWERWSDFLVSYPEITAVAVELATGAAYRERGHWHTARLVRLAQRVARPLTLVVRGGTVHLRRLTAAFDRVVFLSGTPYVKTMKRKRLVQFAAHRTARWVRHRTGDNELLDSLLAQNLGTYAATVVPLLARPQPGSAIA